MKKINRVIVAIGLALLSLYLAVPTVNTASADGYSSTSDNSYATDAGYIALGVLATGVVVDLLAKPDKGQSISMPIGRT